jgi:transposase
MCLAALGSQLRGLKAQILEFDRRIVAWHRSNATSKRLDAIPGGGPALATALVASIADPKAFRSGRDFSAWIGLVPKQSSSGGKDKLGSISKQGDRYLRSLFTAGALAVRRLDNNPQAMRRRRETVEHLFGTMKARMGATHFLTKTLPKVAPEMALSVLAYNPTRS